jgi:hypothetical protein
MHRQHKSLDCSENTNEKMLWQKLRFKVTLIKLRRAKIKIWLKFNTF